MTPGWAGIRGGMEYDFGTIASRTERHASKPRYRAEDLACEAWEASAPRRAVLARQALALWPDCADAEKRRGESQLLQRRRSRGREANAPEGASAGQPPKASWTHATNACSLAAVGGGVVLMM